MKKILKISSLSLLVALTACSGSEVKSTLGLKKRAPDEFMVLSRPALTVPPQFDLPDPTDPSMARSKDFSSSKAEEALFGEAAKKGNATSSSSEKLFLNKAGAAEANSNIRQLIEEDIRAAQPVPEAESEGFFSRLFSPIKLDGAPDPVVNPEAEKERIRAAKAEGETITGEEAATIQPKSESLLDRIF